MRRLLRPACLTLAHLSTTQRNRDYDYGNAVLRLGPALALLDWFAPTDWATLNRRDLDLGSTGPTLLADGRVLQIGKTGTGYLLRADQLGHLGGEVFAGPVCDGAYGGTAHQGAWAYVPCRNGLAAVQVTGEAFTVAWRGPAFAAGPPIVAGDTVWTIDQNDGTLYGLRATDGRPGVQVPRSVDTGPLPHFLSPAAAAGRLIVPQGRSVVALGGPGP